MSDNIPTAKEMREVTDLVKANLKSSLTKKVLKNLGVALTAHDDEKSNVTSVRYYAESKMEREICRDIAEDRGFTVSLDNYTKCGLTISW